MHHCLLPATAIKIPHLTLPPHPPLPTPAAGVAARLPGARGGHRARHRVCHPGAVQGAGHGSDRRQDLCHPGGGWVAGWSPGGGSWQAGIGRQPAQGGSLLRAAACSGRQPAQGGSLLSPSPLPSQPTLPTHTLPAGLWQRGLLGRPDPARAGRPRGGGGRRLWRPGQRAGPGHPPAGQAPGRHRQVGARQGGG